jgi:hypothetical protein
MKTPTPNIGVRERQEVPDDELDERAALEAARLEEQREPVDLIGRAA